MSRTDTAVSYDKTLKLMSIHPSAWALTPLWQWFEDYTIITIIKNPLDSKFPITYITDYLLPNEKPPVTVKDMKQSAALSRLVDDRRLMEYKMVMSKPPAQTTQLTYLSNNYSVANLYENKVWLRKNFSTEIPFPKFIIKSKQELNESMFVELVTPLNANGVVLQHPTESGGRGTYIVKNQTQLDFAVNQLMQRIDQSEEIVISELLGQIKERSIQVCITDQKTLVGPVQAQLVGQPELTSNIPGSVQFCGGRIASDLLPEYLSKEVKNIANTIATKLKKNGYKGIFGIDFIVSGSQLFCIEVNARLTGLTALLAFLQKQHPFLLLHILELANSEYSLEERGDLSMEEGSFVLVYAKEDVKVLNKTGVYDSDFNYLRSGFEDNNILPSNQSEYFIAMKRNFDSIVPAGKSIAFIYSKRQLFNDNGELEPKLHKIISNLQGGNPRV